MVTIGILALIRIIIWNDVYPVILVPHTPISVYVISCIVVQYSMLVWPTCSRPSLNKPWHRSINPFIIVRVVRYLSCANPRISVCGLCQLFHVLKFICIRDRGEITSATGSSVEVLVPTIIHNFFSEYVEHLCGISYGFFENSRRTFRT